MSWGWNCSPKANSKVPIGYACYVRHNLDSYSAGKIIFFSYMQTNWQRNKQCRKMSVALTTTVMELSNGHSESTEIGNLQPCLCSLDNFRLSCRAVWNQTSLWAFFCWQLIFRVSGTAAFGTFSLAVVLSSHFEILLESLQALC